MLEFVLMEYFFKLITTNPELFWQHTYENFVGSTFLITFFGRFNDYF